MIARTLLTAALTVGMAVLSDAPALSASSTQSPVLAAGQTTGKVTGFVFDSTRALPLRGATVVLWGTAFKSATDAEGRFSIPSVPPGNYTVVFFHPRLQFLGIGSGRAVIDVSDERETAVVLTTPSMPTILRSECLLEGTAPGHGLAFGYVSDSRSGVPMAGAKISMRWADERGRMHEVQSEAGKEGWFRACSVPMGAIVAARATFLNLSSTRRVFEMDDTGESWVNFLLGEYDVTRVSGTLTDQETGDPIPDAEVRLAGTDHFMVSNESGHFQFQDIEPGEYALQVAHIAYPTRTEQIDFGSDLNLHLGIVMAREAIELEPIVVTVEQNELAERLAAGGQLITASEVERVRRRSTNLADVLQLQQIRGLQVRRIQGNLCAEFSSGQVRLMKTRACESLMIYIDNARVSHPTTALDIPAESIDRMVIYRPVEAGALFGTGAAHGVLMVYTKNGRRRGR